MNSIDILYADNMDGFARKYPEELVMDRFEALFKLLQLDGVELSCSFVSDEDMRLLNSQWRGKDEPTDILSFVQEDGDDIPGVQEGGLRMLGDLIISPESLKRNSEYFTVSEDEELHRLLVHGVLHLLGGDHETNEPDEPMLKRQEELLAVLRR